LGVQLALNNQFLVLCGFESQMYDIFGSEVGNRESKAGDDDHQQKLINHDVGHPDAASSRIQAGYAMHALVLSV
jgi:hypothetical protein